MSFHPWSKYRYANAIKYLLFKGQCIDIDVKFDAVEYIDLKVDINKYNPVEEKYLWWFDELYSLFQKAYEIGIVKNIIMHGSYGDNTYTNFSDIDLTVLISDDVFNNHRVRELTRKWVLTELNPFLVRIDPLQHHGAFFLWEGLVRNYNEMILPLSSYQASWALEDLFLKFRVPKTPDTREQYNSFATTVNRLLDPDSFFLKNGTNPYSIKQLISNFLLVPAFYYQSHGIIINKQESIRRIKEEVGDDSGINQGIISATCLRNDWAAPPPWLGFLRSLLVKEQIPGNKIDRTLARVYRHRGMETNFKSEFLKVLPKACEEFLAMGRQ